MDFNIVKELIIDSIKDAEVEIIDLTGTRDHLGIKVISDEFKGKLLLQQHRMVMNILKEKIKGDEIHAVQLKTLTKEQAKNN